MKNIIDNTRKIVETFPQKMGVEERFIDLVEEVGELAQAILITRGKKYTNDPRKQKTIEDVADALSDILFNLIVLADGLEIDLEREYQQMLKRLQERLDKGEFKNE